MYGRSVSLRSLTTRMQVLPIAGSFAPKLLHRHAREKTIRHLLLLPNIETLHIQLHRNESLYPFVPKTHPFLDQLLTVGAPTLRHIYLDMTLDHFISWQQCCSIMPRFEVVEHLRLRFAYCDRESAARNPPAGMLGIWAESFPKLTLLEVLFQWDWRDDDTDPTSFLAPFVAPKSFSLEELRVGLPLLRLSKEGQFQFFQQLLHLHAASLRTLDLIPFYLHNSGIFGNILDQDRLSHAVLRYYATPNGLPRLTQLRLFLPQSCGDKDALSAFLERSAGHLRSLRIFPGACKDHTEAAYASLDHQQAIKILGILAVEDGCSYQLSQLDLPVQVLSTGLLDTLEACISVQDSCLRFCFLGTAGSAEHDEVSVFT